MKVPEKYRLTSRHPLARGGMAALVTDSSWGNNGMFFIPHYKIDDYAFTCKASDGSGIIDSEKWEHVSVTIMCKHKQVNRCPTWAEMCFLKDLFWGPDEAVMQLHPPKSEYVNNHEFCLHLWKPPVFKPIPLPPAIFVGMPDKTPEDFKQ